MEDAAGMDGRKSECVQCVQIVPFNRNAKRDERKIHCAAPEALRLVVSRTADSQMRKVHKCGECSDECWHIGRRVEQRRPLARQDFSSPDVAIFRPFGRWCFRIRSICEAEFRTGIRVDERRQESFWRVWQTELQCLDVEA